MNDLENRLRALSFREPPPGLRGAVLAVRVSRWRTPPVAAWAALAAVWLALLAINRLSDADSKPLAPDSSPVAVVSPDAPTPLGLRLRAATAAGAGLPAF